MEMLIPILAQEKIGEGLRRQGLRHHRYKTALDRSVWFLNNLMREKEQLGHTPGEYTNLSTAVLRRRLTQNGLDTVRNTLSETGILRVNTSYSARAFSKSYGLEKGYFEGDFTEHRITTPSLLPRPRERAHSGDLFLGEVHRHIGQFGIDYNVYRCLGTHYQAGELSAQQYMAAYFRCKEIDFGDYFAVRDSEGRMYTNFTNLPRILRPFISRRGGQALDVREVDVSACMAFLLGVLLEREATRTEDIDRFIRMSREPGFYQAMAGAIGYGKKDFKTGFLVLLNERNEDKARRPAYRLFQKEFAGVAGFIEKINKRDNAALYRRCVALESKVMVDRVYRRLVGMGVAAFPIHDGVLAEADSADLVARLVRKAFREETGAEPVVRVK